MAENFRREPIRQGMLTVIERLPNSRYRCACDCGRQRDLNVGHFNSGTAISCGCTRRPRSPSLNREKGPAQQWVDDHQNYAGHDCLPWPFYRLKTGYGRISGMAASRFMCIRAHGEPPSSIHHAAHRCTNKSCVNPQHLYWATPSENMMDKVRDGTSNRGVRSPFAKLTPNDVLAIRERYAAGSTSYRKLGAVFAVSAKTVQAIVTRKKWGWL